MATKHLFDEISFHTSKETTLRYSTSFSLGIRFLTKRFHEPIYNIYGFVRFADEIVDTFHGYDQADLLACFIADTYKALDQRISLNPILNSFQKTVHEYRIPRDLIATFLRSMEMDLHPQEYSPEKYKEYILGSAEVVGLMCLRVFVENDDAMYERLTPPAMSLGAAFQKINFLRDLREDGVDLNRVYFPNVDLHSFDAEAKKEIEKDIAADFAAALEGIRMLPRSARFGVYLAYAYYIELFRKIRRTSAERVLHERIRVSDTYKMYLLLRTYVFNQLGVIR
jgi:phytoene/squalene synthetase